MQLKVATGRFKQVNATLIDKVDNPSCFWSSAANHLSRLVYLDANLMTKSI